jgi:hypothetical protein
MQLDGEEPVNRALQSLILETKLAAGEMFATFGIARWVLGTNIT